MHYHSGTMSRVSPTLHREQETRYLEINPGDARTMGIKSGQRVKVSSRRGEFQIQAQVSRKVDRSVVFIPFHFAEA